MDDRDKSNEQPALAKAIKTMPRWKWKLLAAALVIGLIGVVGQAFSYLSPKPAPTATKTVQTTPTKTQPGTPPANLPGSGSGFLSNGSGNSTDTPSPNVPVTPQSSTPDKSTPSSELYQAVTPFLSHVGFSLFIGVVVGLIFRTFLRMALLATAALLMGVAALSYFHIVNVDMTAAVKADAAHATSWLTDQGYRLRDMLFSALPSSTAATIGFFMGFKKR